MTHPVHEGATLRIAELIRLVSGGAGAEAADELVQIGLPAVPTILRHVSQRPDSPVAPFDRILLRLAQPGIVPLVAPYIVGPPVRLAITAYEVLGRSGGDQATPLLLEVLDDAGSLSMWRALAAEALGELGDPRAVEPLRAVIDPALAEGNHDLALCAVVALAKLGVGERGAVAVALARYQADRDHPDYDEASDDSEVVRIRAVTALLHVVAPGMVAVLRDALRDPSPEIRHAAVEALFHLGTREAIEALIAGLGGDGAGVGYAKRKRLGDLVGVRLTGPGAPGPLGWWAENGHLFPSGICYRFGGPFLLPRVQEILDDSSESEWVRADLRVVTGVDFGAPEVDFAPPEQVAARFRAWLPGNAARFDPGAVYTYGHKQALASL